MKTGRHSTGLFIKQALNHSRILTTLLESNSESPVDAGLMEKCIIGTKMMANSASLLSLGDWAELLDNYESLLLRYRNNDRMWDERIAQITSELIEKEESFSDAGAEGARDPESAVSQEELQALLAEVVILMTMDESADAVPDECSNETGCCSPCNGDAGMCGSHEEIPRSGGAADGGTPGPADTGAHEHIPGTTHTLRKPAFLGGMIAQLDSAIGRLLREWNGWKTRSNDPSAFDLRPLQRDSHLINFYALSLVEIAEMNKEALDDPAVTTLEHLKLVLDVYAAVLSERDGCRVDIGFLGEDVTIDVSLLFDVSKILKSMLSDISQRSTERYLRIEIEVEDRNGSLRWCVRDNGNNFITDSRLDRDDFLAFYPGLREVKKQLERFHGALWVEPDEDHDSRFAFTVPRSLVRQAFHVWGTGGTRFCMPATQVCEILKLNEAEIHRDARGEQVIAEGRPVPVLKLSLLCPAAPEHGDRIVVAGSLEKRIAFYVHGTGNVEEGVRRKISVPSWRGLSGGVAEMADGKIPVIEAGTISQRSIEILGDGYDERLPGGIAGDVPVRNLSEAREEAGLDSFDGGEEEVDILVIEKSRAVRDALLSILAPTKLAVRMCGEAAEAARFLERRRPALIISDAREPITAAGTVVGATAAEGREIPVIISTAQKGETAAALAKELGADGYLLKPLDSREVMKLLKRFIMVNEDCALPE